MQPSSDPGTPEIFPEEWVEGMDMKAYSRRQVETMGRVDRDENTLWKSVISQRIMVNQMYQSGYWTVNALHDQLQDLWFEYYVAGKSISGDSPAQDRLVIRLIQTQSMGSLANDKSPTVAIDVARTVDGVLWTDLPYLATDMRELWTANCPVMAAYERANLSSFLAKLASLRLCNDQLCTVALMVLRDALEISRPLGEDKACHEKSSEGTVADLTVKDLLPSACAWLEGAGGRIIQLADLGWHDCMDEIAAPGSLYKEENPVDTVLPGFSVGRWMFWFRRLSAIESEANRVDLGDMIAQAKRFMMMHIRETNSGVIAVLEASGITP